MKNEFVLPGILMQSYEYGYPVVVMDVTREVVTTAPAHNAEGTVTTGLRGTCPLEVSP